jgi:hypothetical protein
VALGLSPVRPAVCLSPGGQWVGAGGWRLGRRLAAGKLHGPVLAAGCVAGAQLATVVAAPAPQGAAGADGAGVTVTASDAGPPAPDGDGHRPGYSLSFGGVAEAELAGLVQAQHHSVLPVVMAQVCRKPAT